MNRWCNVLLAAESCKGQKNVHNISDIRRTCYLCVQIFKLTQALGYQIYIL